jgi:hydroxymethylbilane synthase
MQLYAVGQGAIGVEVRKNDNVIAEMLNTIGHTQTTLACMAERSLLRSLEGGCSVPLGWKQKRYMSPTESPG